MRDASVSIAPVVEVEADGTVNELTFARRAPAHMDDGAWNELVTSLPLAQRQWVAFTADRAVRGTEGEDSDCD